MAKLHQDSCLPFCFLGHHPFEEFRSPISGIQLFRFREFLCDDALISVYGKTLMISLHSVTKEE